MWPYRGERTERWTSSPAHSPLLVFRYSAIVFTDIVAHFSVTAFLYLTLLQIVTGIPSTVMVLFYKLFYNLNML